MYGRKNQRPPRRSDFVQAATLLICERHGNLIGQDAGEAGDGIQGRAQLVREDADELVLEGLGLTERLELLPCFLRGLEIGDVTGEAARADELGAFPQEVRGDEDRLDEPSLALRRAS